jgi:hypothetical protein
VVVVACMCHKPAWDGAVINTDTDEV